MSRVLQKRFCRPLVLIALYDLSYVRTMDLFIMRHGPAERVGTSGVDADRALTDAGRERVRGVARALLAAGEVPEQIITSSLTRARETGEIVRAVTMTKEPLIAAAALSMTNRVRTLIDELIARGLDRRMLVGHEPELSAIVRELTGTSARMEPAMVVGISLASSRASVRFVLDPTTFEMGAY